MRLAGIVILIACAACVRPPERIPETGTRDELDAKVRALIANVPGGPCAQAAWLRRYVGTRDGLAADVGEDLEVEYEQRCHPTARLETPTAPEPSCDATCLAAHLADCQNTLDTGTVDGALRCWDRNAWAELPAEQVAATRVCLRELAAVEADVASCTRVKPNEHGDCVAPYFAYAPKCRLLDATEHWWVFQARMHLDADGLRRDAAAREVARCSGRTTLDLASELAADPALVPPSNCTYELAGKVASSNNVYVELVDPVSGKNVFLVATREKLADGTVIAPGRRAKLSGVEQAEMADGSTRPLPVFKLVDAARTRR